MIMTLLITKIVSRGIFLASFLFLLQCSAERDTATLFTSTEQGAIVVDAVLYVDQPMPEIIVSLTQSPDSVRDDENAGVIDAEVTIYQGLAAYRYHGAGQAGQAGQAGWYIPPEEAPRVLPETEYRLLIRARGREVRGATTTPGRLSLKEVVIVDEVSQEVIGRLDPQPASQNRVVYRKGLIEARFDPLDVDAYQIVVLVKDTGDEAGSPPLEVRDGRLRLPWFVIDSSGPHEIDIYALDRNLFDFVRSIPQGDTGFGIGSLAGDNFERPIFHLDGGIGVFGSASVDSFEFVVLPEDGVP